MNFPAIIALTGRKYSGKDTAADCFTALGYERVKFAGALKEMLRALYRYCGMPANEIERRIEGDMKEEPCDVLCGETSRRAMETIGTEWGRQMIAEEIWVSALKMRAVHSGKVIVTDLRFPNELQAMRALGGIVGRIIRPKFHGGTASAHISEQYVDDMQVDFEVRNNGTVDALHKNIIEEVGRYALK